VSEPVDGRSIATAEKRLTQLTGKVATLVDLLIDAGEAERAAYRRSIAAHEAERGELVRQLDVMRQRARQHQEAKTYTAADAKRLLRLLCESLSASGAEGDVQMTKAALGGLVERIVLDASTEHCHIHYRIGASLEAPDTGVNVATLRGCEATPVRWVSGLIVAKRNGTSG
jgi:hypothetical protein